MIPLIKPVFIAELGHNDAVNLGISILCLRNGTFISLMCDLFTAGEAAL